MIDKVYLLNLPECGERRRHMDAQLRGVGLGEYEIHGISGRLMSEEQKSRLNRDRMTFYQAEYGRTAEPMTRGQLACFQTHREIQEAILASGCRLALVLEDDIRFNDNFANWRPWLEQLEKVDPQWDMVLLNCVPNIWPNFDWTREMFPEPYLDRPTSQPNILQSGLTFGTNSQLISRRGAAKLLALTSTILEPWDLQIHIGHSSRPGYAAFPRIGIYCFTPYLTTELAGQHSHTQAYV